MSWNQEVVHKLLFKVIDNFTLLIQAKFIFQFVQSLILKGVRADDLINYQTFS